MRIVSIIAFAVLIALVLIYNIVAQADVQRAYKPSKIVVLSIDTGIDIAHSVFKYANISCQHPSDCRDLNGHGTHVASLILNGPLASNEEPTNRVCPQVEFHSCNYRPDTGYPYALAECLQLALDLKPDFVNFSSVGNQFLRAEYDVYDALPNTQFVVAAGNSGVNLYEHPAFPAIFPQINQIKDFHNLSNVTTVGATHHGKVWASSNYADFVVWEEGVNILSAVPGGFAWMSGSSMATAIRTNKLLKEKCSDF